MNLDHVKDLFLEHEFRAFLEMILDHVMDLLRNIKIEFWAWDGFYFIDP